MVTATLTQELDSDYDVSYRDLQTAHTSRELSSRDRFAAKARHSRGGKGRVVNGAHRRRDKRNYL